MIKHTVWWHKIAIIARLRNHTLKGEVSIKIQSHCFDQLTEAIKRNYRIQILLKSTLASLKMNRLYNWNLYLFSNSQENERTTPKTKRLIILILVCGNEFIRGYQSPNLWFDNFWANKSSTYMSFPSLECQISQEIWGPRWSRQLCCKFVTPAIKRGNRDTSLKHL